MSLMASAYIILRPTVKGTQASDLERRLGQTESNPYDSGGDDWSHDDISGDIKVPGCLVGQIFRQFSVTGRRILRCWADIRRPRAPHDQTPIAQVIGGMHRCTSAENK